MAITIAGNAKVVVWFNSTRSFTQIRNFFQNTVLPDVRAAVVSRVTPNFNNVTFSQRLGLEQNVGGAFGVADFEAYAKVVFSGDTELTPQQVRDGFDNIVDDIKIIIRNHATSQGATIIGWHVHRTSGHFDEVE